MYACKEVLGKERSLVVCGRVLHTTRIAGQGDRIALLWVRAEGDHTAPLWAQAEGDRIALLWWAQAESDGIAPLWIVDIRMQFNNLACKRSSPDAMAWRTPIAPYISERIKP